MAHMAPDRGKATRRKGGSVSAFAWYWHRLRCMSPGEIGYRVRQQFISRLQQFGLTTAHATPEPNLSMFTHDFVRPAAEISARAYTETADEILNGKLRIFALDYVFETSPQWNAGQITTIENKSFEVFQFTNTVWQCI